MKEYAEKSMKEYAEKSLSTENFLPSGPNTHVAIVRMEELMLENGVLLEGMSRNVHQLSLEGISEQFAKTIYAVNVSSDSAVNFRNLISDLMQEERVWNVTELIYHGDSKECRGSFNVEIFYFSGVKVQPTSEVVDTADATEAIDE